MSDRINQLEQELAKAIARAEKAELISNYISRAERAERALEEAIKFTDLRLHGKNMIECHRRWDFRHKHQYIVDYLKEFKKKNNNG